MYLHDRVNHSTRASSLVRRLVDRNDPKYGVSSMTCSVYDTAWVAMVAKTVNGETQYLFPSSFDYLLRTQQPDGGWGGPKFSSDMDRVLNSLAALLALSRHISRPYQLRQASEDLKHRKVRATYFLDTIFSQWDVDSTATDLGFQPLITKLLQMLEQEDVRFAFPGRELFLQTKPKKRKSHTLSALYGSARTTATHSLEGRIGEIDFDRVGQHKIFGSMMASPASTAAYLMNCTTWDDEAEAYLRHILSVGEEISFGGVPAKFPTTVFELTGVILTLMGNGFTPKDLGIANLDTAADFLQDCLQLDSGVTGFAPYVESDADNTAKSISALALLGRSASPQGLISRYETREYFKTYSQDRNPSFRTNCHVLKALLDLIPENSEQMAQIEKLVIFLCNCWWTTNGRIDDQSNRSPNYPIMLMVDVFVQLIQLWAQGCVPVPNDPAVQDKVIICLFQALIRTLQTQKSNGSWGSGGCETAAYAVLTLTKVSSLTSAPRVKLQLTNAIENGRRYISKNFRLCSEPDHIWTGKTTSGSSVLYQAYVMAALQAPISKKSGPTIETHFEIPLAKVMIQTRYYAKQAWFTGVPEWLIQACLVESRLFLPQIRTVRYAVLPSDNLGDDTQFESIPFSWIVASNIDNRAIGAEFLYQMMVLSVLGRQLEDYIKGAVQDTFAGCLFELEDIVYSIFQELELYNKDRCFCSDHNEDRSSTATHISNVRSVLHRFISHILNHPYVLMASKRDQTQLNSELLAFLLSRVSQPSSQQASSATDQTPHGYVFAFIACLVGNQSSNGGIGLRRDFLETPEQQYLAADLCRHVSIISFMSTEARDQKNQHRPIEAKSRSTSLGSGRPLSRSVSSVSTSSSSYADESGSPVSPISSVSSIGSSPRNDGFSKSFDQLPHNSPHAPSPESLQMARLLDHERRCLSLCLQSIGEADIDQRTANILKLLIDATELSEHIHNDPNVGSCYRPATAHEAIEQACILEVPPVPPKKRRGSVAAARAALTIPPLAPKQHRTSQDSSQRQSKQPLAQKRAESPQSQNPSYQQPSQTEGQFDQPGISPEFSYEHSSQLSARSDQPQSSQKLSYQQPSQTEGQFDQPGISPEFSYEHSSQLSARSNRPQSSQRYSHQQPFRFSAHSNQPQPHRKSSYQHPSQTSEQSSQQVYQEVSQQLSKPIFHHVQQQASRSQSCGGVSERTLTPSQEKVTSPAPMERDWSWNRKPGFPTRRPSRASSEVSRIERIMSDVDDVRLQPKSQTQRRTASESDAVWISKPKVDAQSRLDVECIDADDMKLATVRLQTQKRVESEAKRKAAEAQRRKMPGLQSKSMINIATKEKREVDFKSGGWVKAPPPLVVETPSIEMRTGKLHRASRLGGPRWKAPF